MDIAYENHLSKHNRKLLVKTHTKIAPQIAYENRLPKHIRKSLAKTHAKIACQKVLKKTSSANFSNPILILPFLTVDSLWIYFEKNASFRIHNDALLLSGAKDRCYKQNLYIEGLSLASVSHHQGVNEQIKVTKAVR